MIGVLGHDFALLRLYWARDNQNEDEMNGVLGNDFVLVRLYWAGDNLG